MTSLAALLNTSCMLNLYGEPYQSSIWFLCSEYKFACLAVLGLFKLHAYERFLDVLGHVCFILLLLYVKVIDERAISRL